MRLRAACLGSILRTDARFRSAIPANINKMSKYNRANGFTSYLFIICCLYTKNKDVYRFQEKGRGPQRAGKCWLWPAVVRFELTNFTSKRHDIIRLATAGFLNLGNTNFGKLLGFDEIHPTTSKPPPNLPVGGLYKATQQQEHSPNGGSSTAYHQCGSWLEAESKHQLAWQASPTKPQRTLGRGANACSTQCFVSLNFVPWTTYSA